MAIAMGSLVGVIYACRMARCAAQGGPCDAFDRLKEAVLPEEEEKEEDRSTWSNMINNMIQSYTICGTIMHLYGSL